MPFFVSDTAHITYTTSPVPTCNASVASGINKAVQKMRNPETTNYPLLDQPFSRYDATGPHFGHRLRAHREARGLGLAGLADLCGIAAQTLEELESDAGTPGLRHLERLCHGLDISLGELLHR